MKDRVFIDTNILIYSISQELHKREKSRQLLKSDSEFFISTQIINEFINVSVKKQLLSFSEIDRIVDYFYDIFNVIIITRSVIKSALILIDNYNIHYWDSLIVASSLNEKCSILYSEDMHHEQLIENSLRIINPFK